MTKFKALSMLQVRGIALERYGESGIAELRARLSPEARDAIYSELLLPTDWLEVSHCAEHGLVLDQVFGNGDGSTNAQIVRRVARDHFNTLYRSLLAGATPRELLERSGRVWNRYYDRGESAIEFRSDTHAIKRISNCPDLPPYHEWMIVPYYEELLRQVGAKDPVVQHVKCVALGASYCETELRWKPAAAVER